MEEIERLIDLLWFEGDPEKDRATYDDTLRQLRAAINKYFGDAPHYVLQVQDMTQKSEVNYG